MKQLHIIYASVFAVAIVTSCSSTNMKMVCSPGHRSIGCPKFSRGEGEATFAAGNGKKLPSTKPAASRGTECVVTILSKADQEVNIFVDSVWQGSLDAKATGYLTVESGKFKYLHAVSLDEEYVWQGEGDCKEGLEFRLGK